MKYDVTAREVTIVIDDAPQITGIASYNGRARTIRPIRATLTYFTDVRNEDAVRVTLSGPQVRSNDSETSAYFKVVVDVRKDSADNAQWLRDLVEEVRP